MDDIELTHALMSLDLFEDVAYEHIERILAVSSRRPLAAGEILCQPLTIDDTMYVLVEGRLRVESADGVKLADARPVRVIGEMGVLTGQDRSSRVVTTTASMVLAITRDELQVLVDETPDLGQQILVNLCHVLYGRVNSANADLAQLRPQVEQLRNRLAELAPDDPLLRDDPQ